ncbi:hypothetical protein KDK95_05730 [Actinospica sp. MGRD01-02]|uniref:Uncharacterized protein n=1 Tax=Actinospica acidithermotolerans TaxID=2828514 RepID=A0A941E421_9ACTN|nr:hypothetical protein [Actinospica acidithermotolerans]MBR7825800.1 hypothetical protein [Actinospica acidithermotolerans]
MDILTLTVAAIAWAAALAGPARWWRHGRPGSGLMFAVMTVLGTCFLLLDNSVDAALRHAVPSEQNIEVLLRDCAGMILAWCVQMLILAAAYRSEERAAAARWRTALLPAVLIAMTATFLIEFAGKPFAVDYASRWGQDGVFLLYSAIYEGYFLVALWDIRALSVRAVKIAARPSVRAGLRMIKAAAWFALVYVLAVLANLVIDRFHPATPWIIAVGTYSTLVAGLLLVAGILTPVAGIGLETAVRAPERRQQIKQLAPLARMLDASESAPLLPTQEHVTARLVELRDAARLLLPWCDGATTEATEAEVARTLANAAHARLQGKPQVHTGWSLPAWFADPKRLALVADALTTEPTEALTP